MLRLANSEADHVGAEPFIRAACQRGPGDLNADELFAKCATGDHQLWLSTENGQTVAACITALFIESDGLVCEFIAAGGKGVLDHIDDVSAWAKTKGCRAVRLIGRRGWLRKLPDFPLKGVILEKAI